MEVARFRRLTRVTFFLGAMVMCFGLGLWAMGLTAAGVVLLIAGMCVLVICFSITRMFMEYDYNHRVRHQRPKEP